MASKSGDVTFGGTLNGFTDQGGQVGPVDVAYQLTGQVYAWEAKDFPVAAGAIIGGPGVVVSVPTIPAGMVQNLFLVKASLPISFQLNGAGPTYTIKKPGGIFVLPGDPAVTQVEFANAGGTDAEVYIAQVVGNP